MVANALLDMYTKCGIMHEDKKLLYKMHDINIVSWAIMNIGYALSGFSKNDL